MDTFINRLTESQMSFKSLELEDEPTVNSYLLKYNRIHSDALFADLFCGKGRYKYEWCLYSGFFILRYISDDNETVYLQPIGEGDIEKIIYTLEKESEDRQSVFILGGLTPEFVSSMRNLFPEWGFAADRRFADYIYLTDDLKYLSGRKYRSRRKLILQFRENYDFRYEELRPSMFEDCMKLEDRWLDSKLAGETCNDNEHIKKDLRYERDYIENAFRYYDRLSFLGGAIYVGNNLAAFTFGAAINNDVFCTCIEKADMGYKGVFAAIQHQFVSHLPLNFKYLDAEWDCGLPGLRLVKNMYHPVRMEEEVSGQKLSSAELRIRKLWLECFPECDIDYVDSFILNRYSSVRSFERKGDGQTVASLFLIPFGDVAYLYAGMTDPEYRRDGLFKSILSEAIDTCRKSGFRYIVINSDENHSAWFKELGFFGDYHVIFNTYDEFDINGLSQKSTIGLIMPLGLTPLPADKELILIEKNPYYPEKSGRTVPGPF